jgi:hypothetical protein
MLGFPGEGPGPDAVAVPRQSSHIKAKVKATATAPKKWFDHFSKGPAIAAGSTTEGVLEDEGVLYVVYAFTCPLFTFRFVPVSSLLLEVVTMHVPNPASVQISVFVAVL